MRGSAAFGPVLLLLVVLAIQGVALFHELSISRLPNNDHAFHQALIAASATCVRAGCNPVDFWAEACGPGYPVLRSDPPLGYLLLAGMHVLLGDTVSLATIFAWAHYLLLVLWPLSVFGSARLLGLNRWEAALGAALAPLVATDGLHGLELGSYVWRGRGLFTQSLAMHLMVWSLGLGCHSLRKGRRLVWCGLLLAATFLADFVYGYIAALSLLVLALIRSPQPHRLVRMLVLGVVALVAVLPILLPLALDLPWVHRSQWEPVGKWVCLGAAEVLARLVQGELLDAGRLPALSILALLGVVACVWSARPGSLDRPRVGAPGEGQEPRTTRRFILAAAALWLLLYIGQATWGKALAWLGLIEQAQLHRLIGALHFFLILLVAVGLGFLWSRFQRRGRWGRLGACLATILLLTPALRERAAFLEENRRWGQANFEAHRSQTATLDAALALARDGEGRVYAGPGGGWGQDFQTGHVSIDAHLSRAGVPLVARHSSAMSLAGDLTPHFDQWRAEHYRLFNVQRVLARLGQQVAPFLQAGPRAGRFQLWFGPGEGDFDVVSVDHAAKVDRASFHEVNRRWLTSDWPGQKRHLRLDWHGRKGVAAENALVELPPAPSLTSGGPTSADATALSSRPSVLPSKPPPMKGLVLWQGRIGNESNPQAYQAHVLVIASGHLLFKMGYHRNWRATVNGEIHPTVMLSPGFVGLPLEPGGYEVELSYRPELWRGPLFLLCACLLLAMALVVPRWGLAQMKPSRATP